MGPALLLRQQVANEVVCAGYPSEARRSNCAELVEGDAGLRATLVNQQCVDLDVLEQPGRPGAVVSFSGSIARRGHHLPLRLDAEKARQLAEQVARAEGRLAEQKQ